MLSRVLVTVWRTSSLFKFFTLKRFLKNLPTGSCLSIKSDQPAGVEESTNKNLVPLIICSLLSTALSISIVFEIGNRFCRSSSKTTASFAFIAPHTFKRNFVNWVCACARDFFLENRFKNFSESFSRPGKPMSISSAIRYMASMGLSFFVNLDIAQKDAGKPDSWLILLNCFNIEVFPMPHSPSATRWLGLAWVACSKLDLKKERFSSLPPNTRGSQPD